MAMLVSLVYICNVLHPFMAILMSLFPLLLLQHHSRYSYTLSILVLLPWPKAQHLKIAKPSSDIITDLYIAPVIIRTNAYWIACVEYRILPQWPAGDWLQWPINGQSAPWQPIKTFWRCPWISMFVFGQKGSKAMAPADLSRPRRVVGGVCYSGQPYVKVSDCVEVKRLWAVPRAGVGLKASAGGRSWQSITWTGTRLDGLTRWRARWRTSDVARKSLCQNPVSRIMSTPHYQHASRHWMFPQWE